MITHGQARRIAASWHAAGNECSALSHNGEITVYLRDELEQNLKEVRERGERVHDSDAGHPAGTTVAELRALQHYAQRRGVGEYTGTRAWSRLWDDALVQAEEEG